MTIRSVWHINNSQTREDSRFAPLGIMTPSNSSALATANGVVPSAGNPMNLTSTGTMTAQVEVGRAVVQGLLTQGCYPVVVTAPEALTFDAGDATNPRIDSVQIVIRDDAYDSSGFTDVRVVVVKGTPAASPASPALATTASLRLWDVQVDAGVSAGGGGINWGTKLTDRRSYCVALGGISVGVGNVRPDGEGGYSFHALKGTTFMSPQVIADTALYLNSDLASSVKIPGFRYDPDGYTYTVYKDNETITKIATEYHPALLEALAEKIARALFKDFPLLMTLRMAIHKPGAIPVEDVGVEIERRREDYAACGVR